MAILKIKSSKYFFIALFFLIAYSKEVNAKCEMTYEDLDKCALKSNFFTNSKWVTPKTEEELTKICDDIKKAFQCVGTFVKTCMNTFGQTIFGQLQVYFKKDYKDRCVDPDGRKAFIKHINCGGDNDENHQKIFNCVHGYLGQINHQINLHSKMSKEDRISTSCCSISMLHECLLDNIKNICPSSLEYWKSKIILTEHMENICGNFQTTKYCDANASPQFWNELKKVFVSPEKEGVQIKYKSPVTALIVYISQRD